MASNTDTTAANGMQGSSPLYAMGTSADTRIATSQKVRILAPAYGNNTALFQMGVVSQFSPNMSKNVEAVRGIGFGDKIAEMVPSVTEPTTANFERALMYLCNLWQAVGYASGVDGPVRSLAHHRWPFDIEEQVVFSSQADWDLGKANEGFQGGSGSFNGGVKAVNYPQTTNDAQSPTHPGNKHGHTAVITLYEACWFTSYSASISKDSGQILESGDITCTDVHDFSSTYGEFLATGNDPTIGQLGSNRFQGINGKQFGAAPLA